MDIKVRTQTEVSLIDCSRKDIGVSGKGLKYVVASEGDKVQVLGEYNDEKRALEIIDQIERNIEASLDKNKSGIVIQMPKE